MSASGSGHSLVMHSPCGRRLREVSNMRLLRISLFTLAVCTLTLRTAAPAPVAGGLGGGGDQQAG